MKIVYTEHLKKRLIERKTPLRIIDEVFKNKEAGYYDNLRHHQIVVSTVAYHGKLRKVIAVYDKIRIGLEVITLHPISDQQISQRVITGRWTYEK